MLQLTYDGVTHEFDPDRLTVKEARFIKARTGNTPPQFWEEVSTFDGDAVLTLWALACLRAGEPIADLDAAADDFNLLGITMVNDAAEEDDGDDPDLPTSPAEAG
jgi:hypothetical protein